MSHDELVDIAIVKDLNKLIRKQMKAIDTVFELHKPTGWFEDTGYADQECIHCDNGSYPCPTIQLIEKALDTKHLVEPTSFSSSITTTSVVEYKS